MVDPEIDLLSRALCSSTPPRTRHVTCSTWNPILIGACNPACLQAVRATASLLPEEVAKLAQKPELEAEQAMLETVIAAADAVAQSSAEGGTEGGADAGPVEEVKDVPGRLALAREYLECAKRYPSASLSTMVFHTRRMCREWLKRYQLVHRCAAAKGLSDLKILVELCISHANGSIPFECVVFWLGAMSSLI